MSETVIFVVGVVVFAVTVWGAVMAGGLALTRIEIDEEPDLNDPSSGASRKRFPFRSKY